MVPYPKWDENQEGYYGHVDAFNGMLAMPVDAEDYERTGIIVEAMAAETYKHVMSAYYEKSLGDKFFRDAESVEMMDLIFSGIVYDFGYLYDHWNGCTWTPARLLQNNSKDLASWWASVKGVVEVEYERLFTAAEAFGEE